MLTIIFLLLATVSDLYTRTIPNLILIPMFLVSLWLHQNNLPEFFIALLISTIFIITLYKLKFFAGGDAKLLIVLGATVGYPNLFYLFATIFIIGGLQAIMSKIFKAVLLNDAKRGEVRLLKILRTLTNSKTSENLPYALSILLGYLTFLFLQSNL